MNGETPKPGPPALLYAPPNTPYPSWLPKPPSDDDDTAEEWAIFAADLFRARADWRMARTAAAIAAAFAAAEQVAP